MKWSAKQMSMWKYEIYTGNLGIQIIYEELQVMMSNVYYILIEVQSVLIRKSSTITHKQTSQQYDNKVNRFGFWVGATPLHLHPMHIFHLRIIIKRLLRRNSY